jgi:hypothetical protein
MPNPTPEYGFLRQAARIINSGQSNSLMLTGNINDLFLNEDGDDSAAGTGPNGQFLPLIDLITGRWRTGSRILVTYQLNSPIKFASSGDLTEVRLA